MKLRTRLFLWVGTLFFIAFLASLFFENYTVDTSLTEAEAGLRHQIFGYGEKRRERIEVFLYKAFLEEQALIDAFLLRFSRDPDLKEALFLKGEELTLKAPVNSALIFRDKNWIDFIQSTRDEKLTSLLIPMEFPMPTTHFVPITEDFGWVLLKGDHHFERPLMGIRFHNVVEEDDRSIPLDRMIEVDWGLTLLFTPESLSRLSLQKEGVSVAGPGDIPAFFATLKQAAAYVQRGGGKKGWIQDEIRKRVGEKDLFATEPFDQGIWCLKEEGDALNQRIVHALQQGDQAIMITALTSLLPTGAFGSSLFSKEAPKGIARFPKDVKAGHAVFVDQVFFRQQLFDAGAYLAQHPSRKGCQGIGSSIAVVPSAVSNQLFVGNSLALSGQLSEGTLTIAVDANPFVQDLAFSSGQSAFLVHGGRVIGGFDREGTALSQEEIPFKQAMLDQKSGIVESKGGNVYFLHMVPFEGVDLHFFTFEPEKTAFALVRSIETGSREVIQDISISLRVIALLALLFALIVLHRIAKKITKPIAQLAQVTKDVAQGKLEGIELPDPAEAHSSEVATLLGSFDQMVSGLREKEKVQGVLNKVVSPEIAQEITKGTIHLGGEERRVTVLFGDIRNFTRISSHLQPGEVIELLNTCMTRISHEIDAYGGVIDKYVGDEVMALFGAPLAKEDSAQSAVKAALAMVQVLKEWNQEREKAGKERVEMGFGIHTGRVLVGNMGAENRLNYTVIGSNVNFANRLCSMAKGMEVLISKETLEEPHVRETVIVEECPPMEIKGYDQSYVLYRVQGVK